MHPRLGLGIECDFKSTQCRVNALVSVQRVHILPSVKPGMLIIELVLFELCEIVKLKGPAP